MWELDHKKGWAPKNWCFRTVVLEKTVESVLDSKDIKPVNPKGNLPWIFTGRADAEASILWPLDAKSWPIGKDPDPGKDQMQKKHRGGKGWGGWKAITDSKDVSLNKLWEIVKDREAWGDAVNRIEELEATAWLNSNDGESRKFQVVAQKQESRQSWWRVCKLKV